MTAAPPEALSDRQTAGDYVVSVRGLRTYFPIKEGVLQRVSGHVKAVDDVSFDIRRGETVGLVGESGCGKTTLGRCISGLMTPTDGGVYFALTQEARERLDALLAIERSERTTAQRKELAGISARFRVDGMSGSAWRAYRRNCQVVFQDAFSSLNPRHLVKDIVGRPLKIYREASGDELMDRVVQLLEDVGLGQQHLFRYPHQFSGGQRQRISIARALALDPEFVVLDEPTSALDVSVQAQILNLLHRLQMEHGLTYLFISHDLNVVRHMSDRILVMYLGQLAEIGPAEHLFDDPKHPYTEALLAADPSPDDDGRQAIRLSGAIPDPARPPQGCRFHTRCPKVTEICGWEIDDVIRELEPRGNVLEGLSGVTRHSEFSADLSFDSSEQAGRVAEELQQARTPEPLRRALKEVKVTDVVLRLRFEPVEEVRLERVGKDRASACVLHTSRRAGVVGEGHTRGGVGSS